MGGDAYSNEPIERLENVPVETTIPESTPAPSIAEEVVIPVVPTEETPE